jgi:hypothetical protein
MIASSCAVSSFISFQHLLFNLLLLLIGISACGGRKVWQRHSVGHNGWSYWRINNFSQQREGRVPRMKNTPFPSLSPSTIQTSSKLGG